jgi:cell division septum initiation protein DivIVA
MSAENVTECDLLLQDHAEPSDAELDLQNASRLAQQYWDQYLAACEAHADSGRQSDLDHCVKLLAVAQGLDQARVRAHQRSCGVLTF